MEGNLIFVPGFFQGRLFLERVSVENFWTINKTGSIGNKFFPGKEGGRGKCVKNPKLPQFPGISWKNQREAKPKTLFSSH